MSGTSRRGRKSQKDRNVIEGILYILRTGAPWRDLPLWFGSWKTVNSRFYRWRQSGLWEYLFETLSRLLADKEWLMVDSTIVRVHQHGSGPVGGQEPQAMGISKGGLSSKIHAVCDALGYPLDFIITCGQRGDCPQARALLEPHIEEAVLALLDAGYDSDELRAFIEKNGTEAVIAYRKNRKIIPHFDRHYYNERHKVENLFQRLKAYKPLAMRSEKLQKNFKAMLQVAATLLYIKA